MAKLAAMPSETGQSLRGSFGTPPVLFTGKQTNPLLPQVSDILSYLPLYNYKSVSIKAFQSFFSHQYLCQRQLYPVSALMPADTQSTVPELAEAPLSK